MVPTYFEYWTVFISRNSSQFAATQQDFRWSRLTPTIWSTTLKASMSKRRSSHCKVINISARNGLEEVWDAQVVRDDCVLEPTENWIENHDRQEAACKTALPHAPGHEELSSIVSCKIHENSAIAINHQQKKTTIDFSQLCLLEHMKNPRMIDAGTCDGKIRHDT